MLFKTLFSDVFPSVVSMFFLRLRVSMVFLRFSHVFSMRFPDQPSVIPARHEAQIDQAIGRPPADGFGAPGLSQTPEFFGVPWSYGAPQL